MSNEVKCEIPSRQELVERHTLTQQQMYDLLNEWADLDWKVQYNCSDFIPSKIHPDILLRTGTIRIPYTLLSQSMYKELISLGYKIGSLHLNDACNGYKDGNETQPRERNELKYGLYYVIFMYYDHNTV